MTSEFPLDIVRVRVFPSKRIPASFIRRTGIRSTEIRGCEAKPTFIGVCFRSKERVRPNVLKEIAINTRNTPVAAFFFRLRISIRRKEFESKLVGKIYMLYFWSAIYARETRPGQRTVVAHSPGGASAHSIYKRKCLLLNTS